MNRERITRTYRASGGRPIQCDACYLDISIGQRYAILLNGRGQTAGIHLDCPKPRGFGSCPDPIVAPEAGR